MNTQIYEFKLVGDELGYQNINSFEQWAFGSAITPSHGRDNAPKIWFKNIVEKWNMKHPDRRVKNWEDEEAVLRAMVDAYNKRT
jgi:hypothetical protein